MIGSGLKKFAKEKGMQIAHGIAFGSLGGYAASLCEGAGYKQVTFSTRVMDPAKGDSLRAEIDKVDVRRVYRVEGLNMTARFIQVRFQDNPGTMKKIYAFLDWFLPLLERAEATQMGVCVECGCEVSAGRWVLVDGVAHYLHDSCAQKILREIEADNTQRKAQDNGNYLTGLLGALGGAVIGAVLWAIVLNMGYVASLVGLVIGWLAEKGYNLLKGRQGKGKVAILIVAVVVGVLLGTFGAEAITVAGMIADGELWGLTMGDIPWVILSVLAGNPEYRTAILANIAMGLFFAGLGVFALLRKTGQDVSGMKFEYLN